MGAKWSRAFLPAGDKMMAADIATGQLFGQGRLRCYSKATLHAGPPRLQLARRAQAARHYQLKKIEVSLDKISQQVS